MSQYHQVHHLAEIARANAEASNRKQSIKCVVWDLDHTLWDGTLLEDERVFLRPAVVKVIKMLDQRGIVHSIASKNDSIVALAKLNECGLSDYFLYPQINWNAKSASLREIALALNIDITALAFVDDQLFEREEVHSVHPGVLCLDAQEIAKIPDMPQMNPRFLTDDAKQRRWMYLSGRDRKQAEQDFKGPEEEFLASLQMIFSIASAGEEDLKRAEELTVRTHQLNTTGYTYSYEELDAFRRSSDQKLFIAGLDDRYGTYGKIGLALVECRPSSWIIKLLLMSCRVMSRGVGTILLIHMMNLAKQADVPLQAEFVHNGRNRMMYITYKLGGFKEVEQYGDLILLEHNLRSIPPFPPYVKLSLAP